MTSDFPSPLGPALESAETSALLPAAAAQNLRAESELGEASAVESSPPKEVELEEASALKPNPLKES